MKFIVLIIIYAVYGYIRQIQKKNKLERMQREAKLRNAANDQFLSQPAVTRSINASSSENTSSDVDEDIALMDSAVERLKAKRTSKSWSNVYDADSYGAIDTFEAAAPTFASNTGFSKRERYDLDKSFAAASIEKPREESTLQFTAKSIKDYFIMREILGPPRAYVPHMARKAYYDPGDLSRE